jgi:hypothetical protein
MNNIKITFLFRAISLIYKLFAITAERAELYFVISHHPPVLICYFSMQAPALNR